MAEKNRDGICCDSKHWIFQTGEVYQCFEHNRSNQWVLSHIFYWPVNGFQTGEVFFFHWLVVGDWNMTFIVPEIGTAAAAAVPREHGKLSELLFQKYGE